MSFQALKDDGPCPKKLDCLNTTSVSFGYGLHNIADSDLSKTNYCHSTCWMCQMLLVVCCLLYANKSKLCRLLKTRWLRSDPKTHSTVPSCVRSWMSAGKASSDFTMQQHKKNQSVKTMPPFLHHKCMPCGVSCWPLPGWFMSGTSTFWDLKQINPGLAVNNVRWRSHYLLRLNALRSMPHTPHTVLHSSK